jgi:large repetitive protein
MALGVSAKHTFGSAGSYLVALTVTDSFGRKATNSITVSVAAVPAGLPPVARLVQFPSPSLSAYRAGERVAFGAVGSSDADGVIMSYFWEFGDGTSMTFSNTDAVVHTYLSAGNYTVKLTVIDDSGLRNSTSAVFAIAP